MTAAPPQEIASADSRGLREAKRALRARVLAERDKLTASVHASESARIAARLSELAAFRKAATILVTLPFGSEWDVLPLVQRSLADGKTVAIPRVDANARMLVLHVVTDLARDIATGFRAIPEPNPSTAIVDPQAVDWVLVPGVAFDRQGRRLGYGGGYYDRLLPLCRDDVQRAAGAFLMQLVDEVPAAQHDVRIDLVALPDQVVIVDSQRSPDGSE
ncbi:MAG TPA: 5-formyltetrahydrofolate cyclo-ligase [Casimicrobiaceae bacterium]|nr:5-formyltetrahydrofolate cyclo-ligase [Casimicrobiaceae bacterium]